MGMELRQRVIAEATTTLLAALGEDPERDGLLETPRRVAAAWMELTAGYREDPTRHLDRTFHVEPDEADGIVIVRNIPFYSLCEHHLLPFIGEAHVAYLPGERIVGLSKIPRCLRGFARRLQVQERLTSQVADALDERLGARGTAVVIEARHLCMEMRGVQAAGAVTTTSAVRGIFRDDEKARAEVLALIHDGGRE